MGNQDSVGAKSDKRKWQTVPGKNGVLCREHLERKHGRKPDRFLAIRYKNSEGDRITETLGWTSEGWSIDKATAILHEIKENIRLGRRPQSLKEKRVMDAAKTAAQETEKQKVALETITFREIAGLYVEWAKQNRLDGHKIESLMDLHVFPVIGNMQAREITPSDIARLRDVVAQKHPLRGGSKPDESTTLSAQSVMHILKYVRETFNFASETQAGNDSDIPLFNGRNPARMSKRSRVLRPVAVDARRLRILNDKEIATLLSFTFGGNQKKEGQEIRDMILLSLDCGPRAGELVFLRKESVDLETGAVRIIKGSKNNPSTKGGRSRVVYAGDLYPECRDMLKQRVALHPESPWLFPGDRGGPRDPNGLNRIMRRIVTKTGWNKDVANRQNHVVWHTLRHTFATAKLEGGCDIYELMEQMGHEDVSTTEIYLHVCDRAKREKALARIVLAKTGKKKKSK